MSGWADTEAAGILWRERPGPGTPLVLLHGIGANAGSFAGLAEHLPDTYRLLAWNAPGYGGSRPLDAEWPLARDYAEALQRSLRDLGVTRGVVLGHSLGTLIAAAFARACPEAVSLLVLSASAQGMGVTPGAPLPPAAAARIDDLHRLGARAFAAARAPRLLADPAATPEAAARVEAAMSQVEPGGYGQAVRMLASGDLAGTLAGVSVPCAFIVGAEDVVTPRAQTVRAASAIGSAPIEVIAQAGHAMYLERPAAFAGALVRLIDSETEPLATGGHDG